MAQTCHDGAMEARSPITPDLIERAASLWNAGQSARQITIALGRDAHPIIARARRVLGLARMPLRKGGPAATKPKPVHDLITGRDLGRHLVRKLSGTEFVIRDETFREEIWTPDPHGIVFCGGIRLRFVTVMGMTERRVPEDLRHIWPV